MVIDRSRPAGFFSDFNWVLSGMSCAIEEGFLPYVPSRDEVGIVGREVHWRWNWKDYFLQPSSDPTSGFGNFVYADPYVYPKPRSTKSQLENLSAVFRKHSGIQPDVKDLLESISNQLSTANYLGVHFRAGDMRWAPSHPTPPSAKLMHDLIKRELGQGDFEGIYIASTQESFIRSMRAKFPSIEVLSSLDTSSAILKRAGGSLSKLPVLADAFLLGRCKGFIHSASNVSFAAKLLSSSGLEFAREVFMGTNHSRLPVALTAGTVLWPAFSRARARKAKVAFSTRGSWGV